MSYVVEYVIKKWIGMMCGDFGKDKNLNILHKVQLITLVAIVFSISILVYVDSAYAEPEPPYTTNQLDELCRTGQALCQPPIGGEYIGGGAIDMDPDLSPSYAYDYANGLLYHTIIPLMGLALGIAALFLVPYFILKRKNIPSKPYLSLILVGLLLFFGIPYLEAPLKFIPYFISQPEQIRPFNYDQIAIFFLIPTVLLSVAGILLYRSTVIRKLIKR